MEALSVKERALKLLSRRPYSEQEIRRKLLQKSVPEAEADEVCSWLKEQGFLDDQSYASSVVRFCISKGFGCQRVRQELFRRGVPKEFWEEALAEMPEQNDKLDRFLSARLRHPEDADERRRLSAALMRRGFSREEIRSAFSRLADTNTDSDWME